MPKKSLPLPAPLTGKQRSYLRSLAHPLKPVVQLGRQGLTPGVLAALGVALERHELVKVKVTGEAEQGPDEFAPLIERGTRCQTAQIIGRTLVLYRRREKDPKIVLPRPSKLRPGAKAAKSVPAAAVDFGSDDADDLEEEG